MPFPLEIRDFHPVVFKKNTLKIIDYRKAKTRRKISIV